MTVTVRSRVAKTSRVRLVLLAFSIWVAAAGTAVADDPSKELWPEIDVWLRLSPAWRLSLFVPISENLETHYREGNLILQGDYAFGKSDRLRKVRMLDEGRQQTLRTFLVRGGYLGGKSLDDEGQAYSEDTMLAELHVRTPLKGGVLLPSRLRARASLDVAAFIRGIEQGDPHVTKVDLTGSTSKATTDGQVKQRRPRPVLG